MARAVKGVYVLSIIKQLKIWQRENRSDSIPNLELAEDKLRQLFEGSIMSCGWYDLRSFWRILEADFLLVYGGTPRGLKKMGVDSANVAASGPQKRLVKPGDPEATLIGLPVYWQLSYNFGNISVEQHDDDYCVILHDYPDIPPVHALLHEGFVSQALTLAGAEDVVCKATSSPWQNSSSQFALSVTWPGLEKSSESESSRRISSIPPRRSTAIPRAPL